ncbi:RNA-binding domain-containing protein [Colletotrichum falcatum]|nr:RNA-binding domain-containing protein [Colletotrichum falcatum]
MHSIRRAAARATLTSSVFSAAAAAGNKSQTISSALRALNASAISARCFSVAAPRAFSRSVAFRDEEQSQPEEDAQGRPGSEHALFVQNYSFDLKAEDLKEAFSKYGEVVGVVMPPKRTFCFVFFKDFESVVTAAENVDGTFWHGRRIVAKPRNSQPNSIAESGRQDSPSRAPRVYDGPPTATLYIGNISFEATDSDLNNLFASLDGVTDVRVAVDRGTGWPRGFAHADFVSVDAASAALAALQGAKIRDRELRAWYAASATRESGRQQRTSRKSSRRNSQAAVEQRVEAEHEQAEEAQKEQKPEADKQDINWNA